VAPANVSLENDPPSGSSRLTILPGDPTLTKIRLSQPFNLNMIKDGRKRLYALGHISYSDAFGVIHQTQYCSAYSYEAIISARQGNDLNGDNCEQFQFAD
jgi:hypothetical protein